MNLDRILAVRNNKTIYRDGDKVMKVFDPCYPKADVLNEALNQARMEEAGLNIPKVLEVTVIDGKWTIVLEHIKGTALDTLMRTQPEKKEEYMNLFVDLQLTMHEKICLGLNKLKDRLNRRIAETDLPATVRYDLHMKLDEMPKDNKVCHGDFNPSNIIIAEDGTPYILDWSHVAQGNTCADAARTFLLFGLNGEEADARSYLDKFSERSGIPKEEVVRWIPIVAASQTIKCVERERAYFLSWIDKTSIE